MRFGLKENIIQSIQQVFAAFSEVDKAILYGSRAKGNYKSGSDIDLTLKGENLNLSVVNKISLQLDDLLLPYTFDISIFKQISNPDLIDHINRVGIVFYNKPFTKNSLNKNDKKNIYKAKSKTSEVKEPLVAYGDKRIRFFNSFEEQEKDNYSWLASLSPEQHLHYATQLIKRVFANELEANPTIGNKIKFD
jgi:predicted nucleotidyltransferase